MNIRVFENPQHAGIYVAAIAEEVIQSQERPVLGLATGTTPIPFYEALVGLHRNGLNLASVVTVNLDEYIGLPPTHEQSYAYFMEKHLFSQASIPADQIHIPNGMAENLDAECTRYDDILRKHPIDLQILGIGVNGHIGFNEPDDLLLSRTHVVQLRPETVHSNARFFDSEEDVPKQAITMGVQAILQADRIILMAFGAEKADIVARSVFGEVRTDVPASILQLHRRVTMVLDKDSAKGILDEQGHLRTK